MNRCTLGLILALSGSAVAQPPQLQPFVARYEVYVDGKQAGESRIELQSTEQGQWQHRLVAEGTRGLAKLARFSTDQVGQLDIDNARPRLLSARMSARSLIRDRDLNVVFDWRANQVRWQGDIEDDQPAQRVLQGIPATGASLNLQLAFDAATSDAGERVHYILHDRGKASDLDYVIQPSESITVPLGTFSAIPVRGERKEKSRVTTAWYAPELPPTPLRMLQTERGEAKYELRLKGLDAAL